MRRRRVLILGAAGRDFHNFNVLFRDREEFEVVGFTAAQIPDIAGRTYPPVLAGRLYPEGIPIVAEQELEHLVAAEKVDEAWFSYSDLAHVDVMHLASRSIAAGAHFVLAAAQKTMLTSTKPVISITAVRTGVGKSQTTRFVSKILKGMGKKVVAVRHPMPYGDLSQQICQRFATYGDLDKHKCTIEEREEYEPHIDNGFVVYAGVDYERILRAAEEEADVILWDGGNNDTSFYTPALQITLVDPHRPGHEATYHPGEVNVLLADLIVVNKVNTADPAKVAEVEATCRRLNPRATVLRCNSEIRVSDPAAIRGRRVLVVEDGPTLTHGGMSYGAGWYAAHDNGAAELVDPSPYAVGSLAATYAKYPNARGILPAMGYGAEQIRDLEATIRATPADVVVEGTPIELARVLKSDKPIVNVSYELVEREPGTIERALRAAIG